MKLESKSQKVLPLSEFFSRLLRYLFVAFLLIFISIAIGVVGYVYCADLELVDSFHMTAMILTGMGPVKEMTTPGAKLFSSFYALYSGIAFLSISALFFAPIIHRLLHILHMDDDQRQ